MKTLKWDPVGIKSESSVMLCRVTPDYTHWGLGLEQLSMGFSCKENNLKGEKRTTLGIVSRDGYEPVYKSSPNLGWFITHWTVRFKWLCVIKLLGFTPFIKVRELWLEERWKSLSGWSLPTSPAVAHYSRDKKGTRLTGLVQFGWGSFGIVQFGSIPEPNCAHT